MGTLPCAKPDTAAGCSLHCWRTLSYGSFVPNFVIFRAPIPIFIDSQSSEQSVPTKNNPPPRIMSQMANPLATPDQLFRRRSFGALPIELQDAIFFATQCLTQAAGILLELPQSVTAQANVLLARYLLVEPIMSHEFSVPLPSRTPFHQN